MKITIIFAFKHKIIRISAEKKKDMLVVLPPHFEKECSGGTVWSWFDFVY